jgi:hypothetical protein
MVRLYPDHDQGAPATVACVTVLRSILLFVAAATAEIGGARLVCQGWRESVG